MDKLRLFTIYYCIDDFSLIHGGYNGTTNNVTNTKPVEVHDRDFHAQSHHFGASPLDLFGHGLTYSKDHNCLFSCGGGTNETFVTGIVESKNEE